MEVQKRLHGGLETEIETVALRCRHQDRDLVEMKSSAIKSLDLGMEITTLDSGGPKEARIRPTWGAHWRNLANTAEPSMCGIDAACFQINLPTCL